TLLRERGLTRPTGIIDLIQADATAAGRATHGLPPVHAVRSPRQLAADPADDPLQQAAGRLLRLAGVAGAGFDLLDLLLRLPGAAPHRPLVLVLQRTMGLGQPHGPAFIVGA
ncbi:hypothetical protein VM98_36555, partial [Streptomyces rubellomurinus subsp. indigoferus]